MEQQNCLLDTNAVIDFLAGRLPDYGVTFLASIIDEIPNISVITQIELLGFNAEPKEITLLTKFVDASTIYPLTDLIAEECIRLRRNCSIKIPDAIIAATAIVNKQVLVTPIFLMLKP